MLFPKIPANVLRKLFMVSSASSSAEKLELMSRLLPSLGLVSLNGVFLVAEADDEDERGVVVAVDRFDRDDDDDAGN